MKVCIVGSGNIGLAIASTVSLLTDNEVVIYSSKQFDIENLIFHDVENGKDYTDLGIKLEADPAKAFAGADYIFCTYPAFLRPKFIKSHEQFIEAGTHIGFSPGYGGAEYACKDLVEKGVTVFGLQRVPFVARQQDKKEASVLSRKKQLYVATIPKSKGTEIAQELEKMLGIPTNVLNEYLAVTLAPSNPLLHLTGLYNVFKDYKEGMLYDRQLMFYAEWNDETSELLLKYDDELQEICRRMAPLDLSEVVPLRIYYESPTAQAMTKKLQSIKAFEVVQVPLIRQAEGYAPDFNSRMFIEDFPFGIAIIKYFALITGTDTPAIDRILNFYTEKTGICYYEADGTPGKDYADSGVPSLYGLNTIEDIVNFYN